MVRSAPHCREHGAGAGVAGPIVVGGRVWGAMAVGARNAEALPPGSEHRVAQLAELISTAISNVGSRARWSSSPPSRRRSVACRTRRSASTGGTGVRARLTEELNRLLDVATVGTGRFEPGRDRDDHGGAGQGAGRVPPGTNVALEGGSAIEQVLRTGRPAHIETPTASAVSLALSCASWVQGGPRQVPSWLTGGCGAP